MKKGLQNGLKCILKDINFKKKKSGETLLSYPPPHSRLAPLASSLRLQVPPPPPPPVNNPSGSSPDRTVQTHFTHFFYAFIPPPYVLFGG